MSEVALSAHYRLLFDSSFDYTEIRNTLVSLHFKDIDDLLGHSYYALEQPLLRDREANRR